MKIKIVSIFDVKAAVYGSPFFSLNEQTAVRSFGRLVNEKGSDANQFPGDFSLFDIGQFDDSTGTLEGMTPRIICTAASLVKPEFSVRSPVLVGNGIEEVC